MKKIIFSNEQNIEIIKLYEEDFMNFKDIGKLIGVSNTTVQRILKENKINTSRSHRFKSLYKQKKITPSSSCFKKGNKPLSPFKKGHKINNGKVFSSKHKGNLRLSHLGKSNEHRRRKDIDKKIKEILFLYKNKGYPQNKISKIMGCSFDVVKKRLRENNIKIRPQRFYICREKCSLWKGGKSFEPYGIKFNNELREQIRKRDTYTCSECGKTQKQLQRKLSIHHINYDKKNNFEYNLISLCLKCHMKTNFNRKHWENYFKMKMFIIELFDPRNILLFNENRQLIGLERIK